MTISATENKKSKEFFEDLDKLDFENIIEKYLN